MCAKKKKQVKQEPKSKKLTQPKNPSFIKIRQWIPFLIFIAISFLLYFQCIPFDYILDDKIVISENEYTKKGFNGVWDLLSKESFQGYFGEQKDLVEGGRYRPLSLVSFAIENQFFGLNPSISHIINILLYGICAWLIFFVLAKLIGIENKKWWLSVAFITSLIFLFHPVHTEAVANIKGRDEIMAMIFGLLSLNSAINYLKKKKSLSLLLVNIFFFLGLLSKENVITFLAVIPIALWLFRKPTKKQMAILIGSIIGVTIGYLIIRFQVIGYLLSDKVITDVMNNPFAGMTGTEKFATINYTLFEYLRLNVFPHPLTHDYYPYHIPKVDFTNLKALSSLILHALLIGVSLFTLKKRKEITFGIWFYIITLSIVSNLVVGVGTFMNERFIFMASMGLCLVIAYLLVKALVKKNEIVGMVVIGGILLLFGLKTFLRVPAWKDAVTLNKSAVTVSKNSARANSFMATALFNEFRESNDRTQKEQLLNEATQYANKAISIIPSYTNANLMKAGIIAEQHKLDQDLDSFLKKLKPVISRAPAISFITEYCKYLHNRANPDKLTSFYYDVGYNTLFKQKRNLNWSVHYLKLGNELSPNNQNIRAALYEVFSSAGNTAEANKYK